MGLTVNVYRDNLGDCTNGGVSSTCDRLTVINAEGPFGPNDDAPPVKLVKGPMNTVRLVPRDLVDSGKMVMFGGNLAATSDSRFGEAIARVTGNNHIHAAVGIFDRVE